MTQLLDQLRTALTDRYTVEREVGRGGMATVFLAHDLKHDRRVALKVLHPALAASLGPERFLREIQIAARLHHPHILPLYDSGQADTLLYYVMPFVEGESLRDRLRRERQLPVDDTVKLGRDVALALDYAHRQGIVHRDIKPENVMLHEGGAIVTDFGIAKAVSAAGQDSLTQIGVAVGTPAYMSPEQAAGERDPDGRSDVYSLGCVLFEMLTGATPFSGGTPQAVMNKRLTEPTPSVRITRNQVTAGLDQVVTKAMAREPGDRYSSASALAQALAAPGVVTPTELTPVPTPAKSIAVLPFANMSADPENQYLTDGVAEEIINALSKIEALRVTSRIASFSFRGKSDDLHEIGTKLNVATVLDGSVRRAGNRLRVTAQLVNVADGLQLWSERYDRQLEDIFAIQDEIADSIVKALRVMLTDREKRAIERSPTADVQAYDYYLRGRQFMHQFRRTGTQFARRMFERALEIDPRFASAHAGAADCCSFLYMYWDGSRTNLEGADSHSRRALELAPDLAEAHASRGLALSLSQRHEEAEREFETAIRLDPKLYDAHYFYGRALFQQGKYAQTIEQYQEASRIRPEDYQALLLMPPSLRSLGRGDEVEAIQRRGVQLAEKHLELNPDDARALYLSAGAQIQLGERERALERASRALASDPEDSAVLFNVACVYSVGGQVDDGIRCLDKAIQNGFGHKAWLENDSDLDSLRGDPRFAVLLGRL